MRTPFPVLCIGMYRGTKCIFTFEVLKYKLKNHQCNIFSQLLAFLIFQSYINVIKSNIFNLFVIYSLFNMKTLNTKYIITSKRYHLSVPYH